MKKKCNICNQKKDLSEFPKNKRKPDGLSYRCTECNRKIVQDHYYNNKKMYYDKNKRNQKRKIKWFKNIKSKLKCIKCGEDHIACLDFHHKDSNKKEFYVSRSKYFSKKRILDEISKCDVLCANCHRKLHYKEKHTKEIL